MYDIYFGSTLMYRDSAIDMEYKLSEAKLTLKENAAGSLDITVPPVNAGYNEIERMTTLIRVFRDGTEYWRGRVLSEDEDFFKQRKLTCEGSFAFFNDILIPPLDYTNTNSTQILGDILGYYNENVRSDHRFTLGRTTYESSMTLKTTEYKTAYEILKEYFIDVYNAWFKVRFYNSVMYLDYIEEGGTCTQEITFGTNLLDFTRSFDLSDIATVIIPLGPQDENGDYMTIEDVGGDGVYYENESAVQQWGRFEKVVNFDDVETEIELLGAAQRYMEDYQYDEMMLDVSAIDLNYLDNTVDHFELYDKVRCVSKPHGLNRIFPITEVQFDFNNPQNTKFVLGTVKEKKLTNSIKKVIDDGIENKVPTEVQTQISKIDWPEITDNIVETGVIKAETMNATFCYSKYILVQFLETNFEAIDASGTNPTRSHSHRNYIRIYNEQIYLYEDDLTDTIVGYEFPAGSPLYWTAIDGENAYKFFTYQSPLTIAQNKRPSGITDEEFRQMYEVKVWATAENGHHEKGRIGFSETSAQVMEPVIKLGVGDGNGRGVATIYKSTDGLDISYASRTQNLTFGLGIQDDGYYGLFGSLKRKVALPLLYSSVSDAQADVGVIPAYTAAALIYNGGS